MVWLDQWFLKPCRYMQPTISHSGACFTFNLLPFQNLLKNQTFYRLYEESDYHGDAVKWTPDDGFPEHYPSHIPPRRTSGQGFANAVTLVMQPPKHEVICRKNPTQSLVYLHNPMELPSQSHYELTLNTGSLSVVKITPRVFSTSPNLRAWEPKVRGCYYQDERSLKLFQLYSQINCDIECEANKTFQDCGCVPFHFARTKEEPVCSTSKLFCVIRSLAKSGKIDNANEEFCNCLPSCNQYIYEGHSRSADRDWIFDKDSYLPVDMSSFSNNSLSVLQVSFLTKYTTAIRRSELFTGDHFIANIGGLLGLFMGFSILSIVEIIYFLFFRPCYNIVAEKKKCRIKSSGENA